MVNADASCIVYTANLHYTLTTGANGETWPSDVEFSLKAPGEIDFTWVGNGGGAEVGTETSFIEDLWDLSGLIAKGTWVLKFEDLYTDDGSAGLVTLKMARLDIFCEW